VYQSRIHDHFEPLWAPHREEFQDLCTLNQSPTFIEPMLSLEGEIHVPCPG
jgi:hypothetical protein